MGVAPRRFTDSTVSGEPKAGPNEDASSGTRSDTVTAFDGFALGDPAGQDAAAADRVADHPEADEFAGDDLAGDDLADDDFAAGELAAEDSGAAGKSAPRRRSHRSAAIRRAAAPEARRPMLILCVAFGVLVVALAAIAIKLGLGLEGQQRQQNDQQAALHAARQAATDLMSVSYQTAPSDINRILSVSTGSFHAQVSADQKQLVNETLSAHAVSTANVLGAGLVGGQVNGNTATVIVVVDSTITSKNAPNGVVNHYRETITLTRSGGRWLASQVDFATPSGQ